MKFRYFLPWLFSFFTKRIVLTGKGFTTSDESLDPDFLKKHEEEVRKTAQFAYYTTRSKQDFVLVGFTDRNGHVFYRLYHETTKHIFDVDERLFKLIFKLVPRKTTSCIK